MKSASILRKKEEGSVILIAIVSLFTLTVIGIMAISNTSTELKIAGNERKSKIAFFAAESARGYVAGNVNLYNSNNVDEPIKFPDKDKSLDDAGNRITLSGQQTFNGEVEYLSRFATGRRPPRPFNNSLGKFAANVYEMRVNGYGPDNAEKSIEQGFFRIGPM